MWRRVFDRLFPYQHDSWWERRCGEHLRLGPVVLFGFNAMHVALNVRTPWGWVCFHPTMRVFGRWWPWYFYVSQDATPFNCSIKIGHAYP